MRTGLVLGAALLLAACRQPAAAPAEAIAWRSLPNRYARHFEIQEAVGARRLLVFTDTAHQDTAGVYTYTLTAGAGSDKPSLPQRIVLGSTTHVPFVAALGRLDQVVGCAHLQDVRDARVLARLLQAGVQDITGGEGVVRERLVALHPDVVLGYPFGDAEGGGLARADAPVVQVAEYLEEHPLGKAEWLRFFGALLGRMERADSSFNAIAARYTEERDRPGAAVRPRVFFGSTWEKQWFVPPANSYMSQAIIDAGGALLFTERSTGNLTLPAERVVAEGADADIWGTLLARNSPVTPADIAGGDSRILALPAFRNGNVFAGNSAQSDLFGEAALHPEMLLRDLRALFRNDGSDSLNVYFRRPDQKAIPSRR